jgi:hypothetical protein
VHVSILDNASAGDGQTIYRTRSGTFFRRHPDQMAWYATILNTLLFWIYAGDLLRFRADTKTLFWLYLRSLLEFFILELPEPSVKPAITLRSQIRNSGPI